MGNTTGLGKVIIIMICFNVLLYVGGVRVIDDSGVTCDSNDVVCSTMGSFINDEGESVNINKGEGGIGSSVSTDFKASATSTGDNSFIDNLASVIDFLNFLINIVFTPLGLLTGAGMPVEVVILFGVPLITILVLGIGYFVRSGA